VRDVRADVLHADPVDEQLGQLQHPRHDRIDLGHERVVARPPSQLRIRITDHPDARRRRRHDHLRVGERLDEPPHERDRLTRVAGVGVHLPAAGLLGGEVDRHPQPLQQPHHRTAGLGEQGVVQTRDEQRGAGQRHGDRTISRIARRRRSERWTLPPSRGR